MLSGSLQLASSSSLHFSNFLNPRFPRTFKLLRVQQRDFVSIATVALIIAIRSV